MKGRKAPKEFSKKLIDIEESDIIEQFPDFNKNDKHGLSSKVSNFLSRFFVQETMQAIIYSFYF
jgi:hypothetical protein